MRGQPHTFKAGILSQQDADALNALARMAFRNITGAGGILVDDGPAGVVVRKSAEEDEAAAAPGVVDVVVKICNTVPPTYRVVPLFIPGLQTGPPYCLPYQASCCPETGTPTDECCISAIGDQSLCLTFVDPGNASGLDGLSVRMMRYSGGHKLEFPPQILGSGVVVDGVDFGSYVFPGLQISCSGDIWTLGSVSGHGNGTAGGGSTPLFSTGGTVAATDCDPFSLTFPVTLFRQIVSRAFSEYLYLSAVLTLAADGCPLPGSGGGSAVTYALLGTASSAPPVSGLTKPNVSVTAGSVLLVKVMAIYDDGTSFLGGVTWNGNAMTQQMNGDFGGVYREYSLHVTGTATGSIVVSMTTGLASLALAAVEVIGLTDHAVDQTSGPASANLSSPDTGATIPTTAANEYASAGFVLVNPGVFGWGASFTSDGQDVSFTAALGGNPSATYTLTGGHRILTAIGAARGTLTSTTPSSWVGGVETYK